MDEDFTTDSEVQSEMQKEPSDNPSPEYEKKEKSVTSLYEWVEAAVFSLTFVVLAFSFLFRIVGVDGSSMKNTLMDKDRLIISNFMYTPKHGDVVIINRYNQEPLVKRIIAVGGDTLEIKDNQVIVNGEVLQESSYIIGKTEPLDFPPGVHEVQEGYVFVMGDNRENSNDSRYLGYINVNDIMGKALFRFLPLSKMGDIYANYK